VAAKLASRLAAAICIAAGSPAEGQTEAEYRGCYTGGFEVSAFTPLGTRENWWTKWDTSTAMLDAALKDAPGRGAISPTLLVVIQGRVSEEGRHGHMGQYSRQITVSRILAARKPLPGEPCGGPASAAMPAGSDGPAMYRQGLALEKEGRFADALRVYRRAARAGSSKAALRLGEIYERGVPGVARDHMESEHWYEAARKLGEPADRTGKR
jgi:TPR repeat protein